MSMLTFLCHALPRVQLFSFHGGAHERREMMGSQKGSIGETTDLSFYVHLKKTKQNKKQQMTNGVDLEPHYALLQIGEHRGINHYW